MASSNAPAQCSESSRDSVQIVDAPSSETSVHGCEQTGLLGPSKADSSKVKVASSTATVSAAEYSHSLPPHACTLCICMHMSVCARGTEGQVGWG